MPKSHSSASPGGLDGKNMLWKRGGIHQRRFRLATAISEMTTENRREQGPIYSILVLDTLLHQSPPFRPYPRAVSEFGTQYIRRILLKDLRSKINPILGEVFGPLFGITKKFSRVKGSSVLQRSFPHCLPF